MTTFRRLALPGLACALLAACTKTVFDGDPQPGSLRVVSGVHGAVNILVDGFPVISNLGLGGASLAPVAAGSHSVAVQKVGGATSAPTTATFSFGAGRIVVVTEAGGTPAVNLLNDTNAVVPAGATKLRVAHYAQGAPAIDIWRTQPDFGTPIRVMFPFNYGDVSPYLQSTVGDWRVMVSHPVATVNGPMPDTLANSGLIPVATGLSRTVVVVDGPAAGTVQLVVIDP